MSLRISRSLLAVMLATLALLVAACGGPADQAGPNETPAETDAPAESDAAYNDADIMFLEGMIPHHEQAVTMAEMVPDHTDRPELLSFAEDIIELQQAEIEQMQAMLGEAGVADGGHGRHEGMEGSEDMQGTQGIEGMEGVEGTEESNHMPDMAGMMSDEQMSELAGLEGQEFDLLFIDMMIEHHQGAVDTSQDVIEDGEHPEVRALAEEIIAAQEDEIEQMNEWREEWAG